MVFVGVPMPPTVSPSSTSFFEVQIKWNNDSANLFAFCLDSHCIPPTRFAFDHGSNERANVSSFHVSRE